MERTWKTRSNGTEYGPFTDQEMQAFIREGRVVAASEVSHSRWTQGLWLQAIHVAPLTLKFEQGRPPQTPALPENADQLATIAAMMKEKSSTSRRRPKTRLFQNRLVQIAFGGVLACLVFFAVRWLVLTPDTNAPASILSVATGQYPKGIPAGDVQLIRAYLKQETPTGVFEEIKWTAQDEYTTTLDFRTENPFGGMTKTYITANRFVGEEKVRLDGYADMRWITPSDYGVTLQIQPDPNQGRLPL